MPRYLIDTSVIIDFSKGTGPAYSLTRALMQSSDEIGTCGIIVAEFFTGLAPTEYSTWQAFFDSLDFWPIDMDAARRAGEYRFSFARQGIALALADTIIAAVAATMQATLVTTNDRDFPMPDITLLVP